MAPRHPENYSLFAFAMQVVLVQAWGIGGGEGWNEPSWSLSALIICYATFPWIWRALQRLHWFVDEPLQAWLATRRRSAPALVPVRAV